jgi:HEAT repeat protein
MKEDSEQIASLISSLSHPDKKVIRQAADSLISMALHRPELTRRLSDLLGEAPKESRWPIAYVLAHVSPPSSACLHVLRETLDSKDPDIRWAVGLLLVRLGKSHAGVVTLMLDLLKTGSPTQRRMAIYCLRDVSLKDTAFHQALLESLRDPDPLVRVAAVTSLKFLPEIGKDGLDFLLHLFLADPDPRVRRTAALSLAQLGAPSDEARAALKDASRGADLQLKKAAEAALDLLEKKGPTLPE